MTVPRVPARPFLRRPLVLAALAVAAVLAVVALAVLQPWTLVVDRAVAEQVPGSAPAAPAPGLPAPGAPAAAPETAPAAPVVVARGELIAHEHGTSGSVVVLELPDGSRVLRLQDLDTSDGPLLKVWLTDAPVIEGTDGWYVFDDGAVVDLGELKGNVGSSNYPVPPGTDLTRLTGLSIWCERFGVSFAAAALEPVVPPVVATLQG